MFSEVSKEVTGRLFIPGTVIDCLFTKPFHSDCCFKANESKTVKCFMDCRNAEDFSDSNTVIYFCDTKRTRITGELYFFEDKVFFNEHRFGAIILRGRVMTMEFFACAEHKTQDEIIYNTCADIAGLEAYLRENALVYNKTKASGNVVTLSTRPDVEGIALLARIFEDNDD